MSILVWQNQYATGIKVIDDQHRQIFFALNDLFEQFRQGFDRQALLQSLDLLLTHSRSHFLTEEAYMQESGYPDLALHRAEHEKMLERLAAFRHGFNSANPLDAAEFARFVGEWMAHHVTEVDLGYVPFVKKTK